MQTVGTSLMTDKGVDWHNQIKERYELLINSKQRVTVVDNVTKQIVGEAYRADVANDWFVGYSREDKMWNAGRVSSTLPEVMQRKMILAMLKAIFNIDEEEDETQ